MGISERRAREREQRSADILKAAWFACKRTLGSCSGHLHRLAERSGATLPEDSRSAAAFLTGIAMAGALVPELSESTTLRRRWQDFCLDSSTSADSQEPTETEKK